MELTIAKKKFYKLINNIVNFNKLSHAYLIEVDNYDSDFSCVIDFVKLILCGKNKDNDISNLIDTGNYPDLKIIEPEGNIIKKKQLIQLQEEFRNKSFLNNKMIYVIKEADKLNDSSANTILKFLEEPEDDIVAVLVTTSRYKVIETILSRCQVLSVQDNDIKIDSSEQIIDLLRLICRKNELFVNYQYVYNEILPDKVIAKKKLNDVQKIFINYLKYSLDKEEFSCDDEVVQILSKINTEQIIDFIAIIEEEVQKLDYNVNYKLWLDCLFARLVGG